MLRQTTSINQKHKLNQTLRSWLPILQSGLDELKETLEPFAKNNPFVDIKYPQKTTKKNFFQELSKNSVTESIEALSVYKQSLYDVLFSQISPPLFPTTKSQDIACKIIECINSEGYFEYDNDFFKGYERKQVELIRARFAFLEPLGIGAIDYKESFLFQLQNEDLDSEVYSYTKKVIENFENIEQMTDSKYYDESIKIIKKFKNPPALEYLEDENLVLPDIFIEIKDNNIVVSVNNDFYPEILLDIDGVDVGSEFVFARVKEAKELIDALNMRKSTLYKIALMIVEYQYDYFFGSDIKPMKLKNIALDLGYNPSTISRAISNKYLSSPRGVVSFKSFFSGALEEDVSSIAIKTFILNMIKNEDPNKPFSDIKILELIKKEFGINMVRRTITKYRKALNIGSSSERKKIYNIKR